VKFIKPKNTNADKVDWLISERSQAIVKYYAEYTQYSESEVADKFLQNILDDKDFIKWIEQKRNNKRLIKQMEIEEMVKVNSIG
jgi:DNA relaxase NicK